eukprot:s2249_g3.t1
MEMAMKEKQLYKAAIFEEAQSRPAGFLRRNPACSERTEVSDSSTPTEAPPAKRAKTQPAPLDKTIKREPLEQPIKREPLDQPIKREPDRPIKTEPLEQPIKTKPLEQPIKREPGADPINTRSQPEPLEKPVKREPDEGTGGVPLNEEAPCRKEEPASTKVDEEPRAKGLDGQADGHASEGLLDQEKPALVKSAAVMSPAEQQALVKGRTEKPRGGAKKKAQPAEDKDEEEEGDEASCAKPKRGPGRPKGSKKKPAEAKAKAKAKASATAKTKPSPKAKAKNQPKAKAKAKASPSPPGSQDTTYYEQPSKPMKSQKKKTPMKAAVKKATAEEEKKRKSRKSCAYHKTKTLKIREGFSEEEAVRLARIVTCLHHIREPLCTLLDSARFIPLWKHTRPRLMLSKSEFAEAAGECFLLDAAIDCYQCEKLRQLLLQHGTFEKVEGQLERWHEQKKKTEMGGPVTKEWLAQTEKWSKTMCDNAFEWARARGLVSKNPIHGAEEADIPYKTFWKNSNASGSRVGFKSGFEMDVPWLVVITVFRCFRQILCVQDTCD